jgi:hypothetical protein
MEEFQTIATFNFTYEIIVLKSILQNEGIPFLFQNENLISIDPFSTIAYSGIHLKIHSNYFERIQKILDNLNTNLKIVE